MKASSAAGALIRGSAGALRQCRRVLRASHKRPRAGRPRLGCAAHARTAFAGHERPAWVALRGSLTVATASALTFDSMLEPIVKGRCVALAFTLLAAGGCTTDDGGGDLGKGPIAADDMPAYCSQKAAAEFGVERRNIALSPVDTSGGIYTPHGQYPPEGEDGQTFQCQFDPKGMFISVIPTRRN